MYLSLVVYYLPEFIFIDDIVRDVLDSDVNVFWSFEGGNEVKIRDVHGHELGVSCGDYTIEKDFFYQHICRGRCYLTGIVDLVSSNDETGSVLLSFFIAYIVDKGNISDILSPGAWYVLPSD